MHKAQLVVHHPSKHLREPVVNARKHSKDGRHAHHDVEVSHNEIGVVNVHVQRRIRQNDTRQTTRNKRAHQANAKEHRWGETDVSFPQRGNVVECLDR